MKSQILTTLERSIGKDICLAFVEAYKNRPSVANELWEIVVSSETPVSNRAMWGLSHIFDYDQVLEKGFTESMVRLFIESNNTSINRIISRHLMNCVVPEAYDSDFLNVVIDRLLVRSQPVGVRVNCMSLLFNFTEKFPDLSNELKGVIEQELPFAEPAFRARGQKILKALYRRNRL